MDRPDRCTQDGGMCHGLTNRIYGDSPAMRCIQQIAVSTEGQERRVAFAFMNGVAMTFCPFCGERLWSEVKSSRVGWEVMEERDYTRIFLKGATPDLDSFYMIPKANLRGSVE